jgi:hypothetical protein
MRITKEVCPVQSVLVRLARLSAAAAVAQFVFNRFTAILETDFFQSGLGLLLVARTPQWLMTAAGFAATRVRTLGIGIHGVLPWSACDESMTGRA